MKAPLIPAALGGALLLGGCASPSPDYYNHWNPGSVGPRMSYHLTGYRADRDGSFSNFTSKQTRDAAWTFRRHFLNDNPTNPWQQMSAENPDWPYTIWPVMSHFVTIARETLVPIAGAFGAMVVQPVQVILSTTGDAFDIEYDATSVRDESGLTPPEQFKLSHH